MKIRRFAAAAALAAAPVLFAGAAFAQEDHSEPGADAGEVEQSPGADAEPETAESGEEHEISHAAEECLHILEDGGEPDDCQESPSLILPATNEIVWGGISFLLVLVALSKFALPSLRKTMEARSTRIREGLDEAERTKAEAQTILDQYQRQLADARNEANRIIEEARQTADQLRADLMTRAEQEVGELRTRARDDIEAGKERALAELQASVANLSIDLAEKIVEKNLDRDTNRQLVDSYIRQLETR